MGSEGGGGVEGRAKDFGEIRRQRQRENMLERRIKWSRELLFLKDTGREGAGEVLKSVRGEGVDEAICFCMAVIHPKQL